MPRPEVTFLGCGSAAGIHARALARVDPGLSLVFASRDASRAQALATTHGGTAVEGYDAALARERPGIAVIATPPSSHQALALAALRRGWHVVVEKPAFPAVADFAAVADAARRAGRLVLVAENYFYKPATARLRRVIAAGAIGDVMLVSVNALKRQTTDGWRGDASLAGGGPLLEGGVHWVHLMANLGLTVRDVTAVRSGSEEEDSVHALFEYAEGAVGALHFSWQAFAPLGGVRLSRIHGRRGSVAFESNGAFVAVAGRRPSLFVADPRELSGHASMWRAFLRAVAQGRDPDDWLGRARADVALIERIYGQLHALALGTSAGAHRPPVSERS